jgi:hypothetical protein
MLTFNRVVGTLMLALVVVIFTLANSKPANAVPPYGGCDEAWQAPRSEGAAWCRSHGWTVWSRLVVGPRHVVRYSHLPTCRFEDASSGPLPCSWNFDSNRNGLSYYVTRDGSPHYVTVPS